LANAKEVKTFPKPILPVGGVIVVVVVVGTGGAPEVLLGVAVVVVSVIGVPFLRPVTTLLELEPRKELNSPLILPVTLVSPWLADKVFIRAASLFRSVAVWLKANADELSTRAAAKNIADTFIRLLLSIN
jgi:hypothetical protein